MPTERFRILIADPQHFQQLRLERMLNHLGYFRIAPVDSFKDLMALTDPVNGFFDLLILNAKLVPGNAVDVTQFCQENPHIRHVLIYDTQRPQLLPLRDSAPRVMHVCLPGYPNENALQALMNIIDPAPLDVRGRGVSQCSAFSAVTD